MFILGLERWGQMGFRSNLTLLTIPNSARMSDGSEYSGREAEKPQLK